MYIFWRRRFYQMTVLSDDFLQTFHVYFICVFGVENTLFVARDQLSPDNSSSARQNVLTAVIFFVFPVC